MPFTEFASLRGVYFGDWQSLFDTDGHSGRVLDQCSVFCNLGTEMIWFFIKVTLLLVYLRIWKRL
jgi:hypothetical protein